MSTHSIALPGVLQLDRWGLLDTIRDSGTPATRTVIFDYDGDRTAGVIPTNDGNAVVWTGMPSDRFAAEARFDVEAAHAGIVAEVPELAEQLVGARRQSGYRAFRGDPGFLRQAWGDGWTLVGDAAYFKDPLSAHGITDALIGAELVADAIGACHEGEDEVAAMATMQAVRDSMASEMMPAVAAAAALPTDMAELQEAFKAMSTAMRNEWNLIETAFRVPAGV